MDGPETAASIEFPKRLNRVALTPGTRLGPYEITAEIGVGGMGEVYRATDTKLKREVAVKVLRSHVAADPERLARFQREPKSSPRSISSYGRMVSSRLARPSLQK